MAPVRNTPVQSRGGWKQEKVRPSRECFFLTSQSIELSTAPTAASINLSGKEKKTVTGIEFQLTRPRHFKHHNNVSVASLRS